MRDPKAYAKKVETYVDKYASESDADRAGDHGDGGDETMSRSNRSKGNGAGPSGNGNGASNGNGHSNGRGGGDDMDDDDDDHDDDDDDKMSDMGELSDGDDEFMGEMDD